MAKSPAVDEGAAFLSKVRERSKPPRPECGIKILMRELESKPKLRAAVLEALESPSGVNTKGGISHQAIADELQELGFEDANVNNIGRHRNGKCSCKSLEG